MILTQVVHLLLLPPGLQCLMAILAVVLACRGHRRSAGVLAVTAVLSLYLLATPFASAWLVKPLQRAHLMVSDLEQLRHSGYQAIVVLGGGRVTQAPEYGDVDTVSALPLQRLRYAARIQRTSGLPLLVSGGALRAGQVSEAALMANVLREDFGVPVRWLETESRTTQENAEASARMLAQHGVTHVILVTDALHMRRAHANFVRQGLTVLPAATGYMAPASAYSLLAWLTPQHDTLGSSRRAMHEWLGLLRDTLR